MSDITLPPPIQHEEIYLREIAEELRAIRALLEKKAAAPIAEMVAAIGPAMQEYQAAKRACKPKGA